MLGRGKTIMAWNMLFILGLLNPPNLIFQTCLCSLSTKSFVYVGGILRNICAYLFLWFNVRLNYLDPSLLPSSLETDALFYGIA